MASTNTDPKVTAEVKDLLESSYKEVLDAVKHQDDKIGRLFAGISFLTAAALAMANLGGGALLRQRYVGWSSVPPAMLCLAAYILLVVLSVTILIGSLATPLRVPGLARGGRRSAHVDWIGPQSSQIYFGEISRIGVKDWERKWTGDPNSLKTELTQALVGETHNLAVRTQFKYGRMNEAIALFNFALLFLSLTMIFSLAAASLEDPTKVPVPAAANWALASAVAAFFYLQLLSQVRYTRQSMDELAGHGNAIVAILRYLWVCGASTWVLLVGSGAFVDRPRALLIWVSAAIATLALIAATIIDRKRKGIERGKDRVQWIGPLAAVVTGILISYLATRGDEAGHGTTYAICLVLAEATLLTILAVMSPTLNLYRTVRRYKPVE